MLGAGRAAYLSVLSYIVGALTTPEASRLEGLGRVEQHEGELDDTCLVRGKMTKIPEMNSLTWAQRLRFGYSDHQAVSPHTDGSQPI
jgi:hypothetical protein